MSLRDELAVALCSHPEDHEAMHVQACRCWLRADRIMPIIERALAAERAATIEECARTLEAGTSEGAVDERDCRIFLAKVLRHLPYDLSALADALAQAVRSGYADGQSAAAEKFSAALKAIAPRPNQWRVTWPPDEVLRDALAQARREQREKDAAWLKQCADKFYADECDGPARTALRIAAEKLPAQED